MPRPSDQYALESQFDQLTFAIVSDSFELEKWQACAVEKIILAGAAKPVALIIYNAVVRQTNSPAKHQSGGRNGSKSKPFRYLEAVLDRVVWRRIAAGTNAFETVSLKSLFWNLHISQSDDLICLGSQLETQELDFVIDFCKQPVANGLSCKARYGIWRFSISDFGGCCTPDNYLRELCSKNDCFSILLCAYWQGGENEKILAKSIIRKDWLSFRRTLDSALSAAACLAGKVAKTIAVAGFNPKLSINEWATVQSTQSRPRYRPITALFKKLSRRLRNKFDWFFRHTQWGIGIADVSISDLLEMKSLPMANWLPNEDGNIFLADPFVVPGREKVVLFAEEFDYRLNLGRLVRVTVESDFSTSKKELLALDSHLSYPYLFVYDCQLYCIPENASGHNVRLYRVSDDLDCLDFMHDIDLEIVAHDATVYFDGVLWWLFATERVNGCLYSLHAWYANSPTENKWVAHVQNPLCVDIRRSRCAGAFFHHEGRVYRPAQDCSREYGGALALYEVLELSPTQFSEKLVNTVQPNPNDKYKLGFHTVSALDDRIIIDGKRMKFSRSAFMQALLKQIRLN